MQPADEVGHPRMSGAEKCYSAKADAVIDYRPSPAA
jgi:hypothetical protein